ncbi:unnamed protein product [Schistosoma spindalis]|nr:unnamed protein product [Schistosoma spindale]
MKRSISEEKKWWHPNKLPPIGYQSNILHDHDRKSFYPFNSELGYRIFKRIIEMKRTSMKQENDQENPYHSKYVNQMNNDEHFLLKHGVCSQKPNSKLQPVSRETLLKYHCESLSKCIMTCNRDVLRKLDVLWLDILTDCMRYITS